MYVWRAVLSLRQDARSVAPARAWGTAPSGRTACQTPLRLPLLGSPLGGGRARPARARIVDGPRGPGLHNAVM